MFEKFNEEAISEGFKGEKAIVTPYNIRDLQEKNPITSPLHLTHIGYFPAAKFHFMERKEGTPENILIYCDSGKGWVEYAQERHYLEKDTAFIIPANTPHNYGADRQTPWSIYWLHFKGHNVNIFSSIIGKKIDVKDAYNSRHSERLMLFEEMYQNLEMGYNPENLEYITFCLMHFLASLKYLVQFRELKNVKVEDTVQECIHYMKQNLENKLTLQDLSEFSGYSVSHLIKVFTHRTSYPPMVYYNQLRIQKACSYLQFSNLKILDISHRLGYYDPFHFTKAFVKEMGITPKEYRKRYNQDKKSVSSLQA